MNMSGYRTVKEWREANQGRLLSCRWGLGITPEACRAYQTRTKRYVIHFNGEPVTYERANAEYVNCMLPDGCPHLLPLENEAGRQAGKGTRAESHAGTGGMGWDPARELDRMTNPDYMLFESHWNQSLIGE